MDKVELRSVLFIGLARDCAKDVGKSVRKMAALGHLWKQATYLIITNDNKDDTEAAIARAGFMKMGGKLLVLDGLSDRISSRTKRLAFARNEGLKYLWEMKTLPEHLVVMDMDGVNDSLTSGKNFRDAIAAAPADWGGLFANQYGNYYDIYALRHPAWCRFNIGTVVDRLGWYISHYLASRIVIGSRQIKIPSKAKPIAVQSAFGGFGLYKTAALKNCQYDGCVCNTDVCEHVAFNAAITAGGWRLYILPSLQNKGAPEYINQFTFRSRFQRRFDKAKL